MDLEQVYEVLTEFLEATHRKTEFGDWLIDNEIDPNLFWNNE